MFRQMVGKVVRKTPGLRKVREMVKGADSAAPPTNGAAAPQSASPQPANGTTRFGDAEPTLAAPATAKAAPAEAEAAPAKAEAASSSAEKPAAKKATAKKATAKNAAAKKATAKKPAAKKPAAKKAAAKKPAAKKAAAKKPAAKKAETKARADGRSEEEIERLRVEAEERKAAIRAKKEAAEKAAAEEAAAAPKLTGIAAMIAASGGDLGELSDTTDVRATSGVDWTPDDTEVHEAADGTPYWGSIDNDSARSKAAGDTLVIDQWECINCGTCVENTDIVFALPDDAKAVAISQEGPMDLIQDAIDACPVTCIHWTDDPGQYEQLNDAEGAPLA